MHEEQRPKATDRAGRGPSTSPESNLQPELFAAHTSIYLCGQARAMAGVRGGGARGVAAGAGGVAGQQKKYHFFF